MRKKPDRYLRVMAYEIQANDVVRVSTPPIVQEADRTVYETGFNEHLDMVCLNIEGRRHYFERGEQVKLNLTQTFEGWNE